MQADRVTDGMAEAFDAVAEFDGGPRCNINYEVTNLPEAIAAAITTMPDDLLRKLCEERRCVMVPRGVLEVLLALAGVPLNHPQRQQYDDAVRVAREAMGVGSMASDPRQQAQDDGKEQP